MADATAAPGTGAETCARQKSGDSSGARTESSVARADRMAGGPKPGVPESAEEIA